MAGMDWHAVGERVRDRRNELGLTQEQLAAEAGVGSATIRLIETAGRDKYNASTLTAVSRALWGRADAIRQLLDDVEPSTDYEDYNSRIPRMPDHVKRAIDELIAGEEAKERR